VAPPPGAPSPEQATGAPQIELPNFDAQAPSGIPGVGSIPGTQPTNSGATTAPPIQANPLGEAPSYSAPPPAGDASAAPPFETPGVGPGAAPPAGAAAPAYDPSTPAGAAIPPAASLDPVAGIAAPPDGAPPAVGYPPPANHDPAMPDPGAPPGGPPSGGPLSAGAPNGGPPPIAEAPTTNYPTDCMTAQALLNKGQLDPALQLMSRWYDHSTLSEQDKAALLGLLNQLAGTVIYSRENWLAEPYVVQQGDTLDRIATRYNVPPQLMAKINGIPDPNNLQPGTKLKVVPGPFDVHVDMKNRYLVLKLQGRFAGRFPIAVGAEHAATDGEYQVKTKTPNPTYYGRDRAVPPDDPANPLGKYWIDLGNQIAIHGTNDPESLKRDDPRGCVRMHPRDIEDVYDMVTTDSRVIIIR
ncbi:MAG TPA: L,D-transpeptidase family protein, partial [Pirellulales bacterium]